MFDGTLTYRSRTVDIGNMSSSFDFDDAFLLGRLLSVCLVGAFLITNDRPLATVQFRRDGPYRLFGLYFASTNGDLDFVGCKDKFPMSVIITSVEI